VPTPQEEDARRAHRELEQLRHERTAHSNRIGALLVLHNLRVKHVGGRDWGKWWTRHGPALPAALRAGIEREMTRLELVKAQIKTLEAQQGTAVAAGQQPQVAQLSVRGVRLGRAWILVQAVWQAPLQSAASGGCIGLAPTPYSSGDSQTEQGIAKAGNQRARRIMVELGGAAALINRERLEPWFNQRFASGASGCGVSASWQRRLAIALWRYLNMGDSAGATSPIPPVSLEPVTP
jgi:transposase